MIFVFVLGIAIIALGIFALKHSKKMTKLGRTQAKVQNCQESSLEILSQQIPCYEVTFEIYTPHGVTYKSMKDNQKYEIGQYVDIFYDSENDKIELSKNVSETDSKGPYAIMGFGALFVLIPIFVWIGTYSETFRVGMTNVLAYLLAIIFIMVGAFISIIGPKKRKKAMVNCAKVQGTLVDFKTRRRKKEGTTYTPIYSYYYNGQEYQMESNVSGNGSKYRDVGRQVTIVINTITGDRYCLEDMQTSRKIGFIFLIVGVVLCAMFIGKDFFGIFDSSDSDSNDNGNININTESEYTLDINKDGYSTESLDMDKDERYSEYSYYPEGSEKNYAYNIKIYHCGIGEVTIFPTETTGKGLNQFFTFYVEYKDLKTVIDNAKEYEFEQLVSDTPVKENAETDCKEYVYYYDGSERIGSGGYGEKTSIFKSVTKNIKNCVPDKVWEAVDKEIEKYYQ